MPPQIPIFIIHSDEEVEEGLFVSLIDKPFDTATSLTDHTFQTAVHAFDLS